MKKLATLGIITVLIGALVLVAGCTSPMAETQPKAPTVQINNAKTVPTIGTLAAGDNQEWLLTNVTITNNADKPVTVSDAVITSATGVRYHNEWMEFGGEAYHWIYLKQYLQPNETVTGLFANRVDTVPRAQSLQITVIDTDYHTVNTTVSMRRY